MADEWCEHDSDAMSCPVCRPAPALPPTRRAPTTSPKSADDQIAPLSGTKDISVPVHQVEPYVGSDWLMASSGYASDLRPGGWVYLRHDGHLAGRVRARSMGWRDRRPWRTGVDAGEARPGLVFEVDPSTWDDFELDLGDDAERMRQGYRYLLTTADGADVEHLAVGDPIPVGEWISATQTSRPVSHPLCRVAVMDLTYDERKFTEMVLYVADRLRGDRAGGATKLNKVLFFAEFTHLRRHHAVITGCEFQKLPHGPAPRQLLPVRRSLVRSGAAEVVEEDFLGRPQHRLVPLRPADTSIFSANEHRSIDDVLEQLAGMTGTQVSDLSHEEPGWQLTRDGETIPYATAFLDFPQVPTPTSERLAQEVAERYGVAATG